MKDNNRATPYISRQITVYQTDKKLIEFLDKRKSASVANYAHLHADSERMEDGRRRISCIGVTMLDYSSGTGDSKITVRANLSPDTVLYLFEHIRTNEMWFNFTEDKIFGAPDAEGRMQVTKVRILHGDPSKRKLPWYIEIANGTGVGQKNKVGGTYMQAGSFVEQARVHINLSDRDIFQLFSRTARFIAAWEAAVCPSLVSRGHKAIQANIQAGQGG